MFVVHGQYIIFATPFSFQFVKNGSAAMQIDHVDGVRAAKMKASYHVN